MSPRYGAPELNLNEKQETGNRGSFLHSTETPFPLGDHHIDSVYYPAQCGPARDMEDMAGRQPIMNRIYGELCSGSKVSDLLNNFASQFKAHVCSVCQ